MKLSLLLIKWSVIITVSLSCEASIAATVYTSADVGVVGLHSVRVAEVNFCSCSSFLMQHFIMTARARVTSWRTRSQSSRNVSRQQNSCCNSKNCTNWKLHKLNLIHANTRQRKISGAGAFYSLIYYCTMPSLFSGLQSYVCLLSLQNAEVYR